MSFVFRFLNQFLATTLLFSNVDGAPCLAWIFLHSTRAIFVKRDCICLPKVHEDRIANERTQHGKHLHGQVLHEQLWLRIKLLMFTVCAQPWIWL
jgi:hypothetical protein